MCCGPRMERPNEERLLAKLSSQPSSEIRNVLPQFLQGIYLDQFTFTNEVSLTVYKSPHVVVDSI